VQPTITSRRYGPALYKDIVDGKEGAVREITAKGRPGLMPGFRYGLQPWEIDATIEYLKTVPRPTRLDPTGTSESLKDEGPKD
jgi:hypothetical protein